MLHTVFYRNLGVSNNLYTTSRSSSSQSHSSRIVSFRLLPISSLSVAFSLYIYSIYHILVRKDGAISPFRILECVASSPRILILYQHLSMTHLSASINGSSNNTKKKLIFILHFPLCTLSLARTPFLSNRNRDFIDFDF